MMLKLRTMLLRWTLYGLGMLAFVAFCITRSPTAMQRLTIGSYRYGDLYHFTKVRHFKPAQPLWSDTELIRPSHDSVLTNSSDAQPFRTYLFGDSFSSVRYEKTSFREALGHQLRAPVYFVSKHEHENYYQSPLLFFAEHPVATNEQRTLFLEMVERHISEAFARPPQKTGQGDSHAKELSWIDRVLSGNERKHEFLLKNSSVTFPIVEAWNTFVFEAFGKAPNEVPVYSMSPPMLFFHEETKPAMGTSFYARHDNELIANLSRNIGALASELSRQYHIRLVFVPVPNKFTIYSRLVTRDAYDEFLPRLVAALESQGVAAVNLVPSFRNQREMLYQSTDTHWNERGIHLAASLVAGVCE
jgi:hypothetical protein